MPLPRASNLLGALAALAIAGCSEAPTSSTPANAALIAMSADISGVSPNTLNTLVVVVSASDIPAPLTFNISFPAGTNVATGTIKVPPGSQRTITIKGYDPTGLETYEGAKTIDVKPGSNPALSIPLLPLTGNIPVSVTLGPVTIVVTPGSTTQTVGGTLQLSASITAPNGDPVSAAPEWATSNPAVVGVDQTGLITCLAAGTADITAVYDGVAGITHITVTSP
jgi:hypothetical protein